MPLIDSLSANATPKDYTKLKITNALAQLMEDSPIDEIRVSEICATAKLSRKTFYTHFSSKFDVVQWFWEYIGSDSFDHLGKDMTWRESLLSTLHAAEHYLPFFEAAGKERGYEAVIEFGPRIRESTLEETTAHITGAPATDRLRTQIKFFAVAEPVVILDFMKAGLDDFDPERLADYLDSCVPRELHDLIDDAIMSMRRKNDSAK